MKALKAKSHTARDIDKYMQIKKLQIFTQIMTMMTTTTTTTMMMIMDERLSFIVA